jgi:hypothetical protein
VHGRRLRSNMSWLLVLAGGGLIAAGVDAGALSRRSGQLPAREIDKMVYGDPPPPLTAESRAAVERRFVVKTGASTRWLAALMVASGAVLVAVGLGV